MLFHGLEGSSNSHYARGLMAAVKARGWHGAIPHFRGCSGEANLAPRFYHSGDAEELDWIIRRLRPRFPALLRGRRLAGRQRPAALAGRAAARRRHRRRRSRRLRAARPGGGGAALSAGFNRLYTRMFLETLKPKALAKLERFPGLFDRAALLASNDLYSFDNVVTAPLHGYRDTDDYWHRASARHVLHDITVPTLVLNARNDPFLPGRTCRGRPSAPSRSNIRPPAATSAFPVGPFPGRIDWLPRRILHFFDAGTGHARAGAARLCQA
jgi:predicted alpha/beta-fold hydrolase